MLKRFFLIFFSSLCLHSFAQETFPVNGVATEFEPIFAFINAHIIDAENETACDAADGDWSEVQCFSIALTNSGG